MCAVLLLFLSSDSLHAADPAESRQTLLELRFKLLEAQAKLEVARWAASERVSSDITPTKSIQDRSIEKELKTIFEENDIRRQGKLEDIERKLKDLLDESRKKWEIVTADSLVFQEDAAKMQAVYEFNWRDKKPPRFELGMMGWLTIAAWLLMLAACVALCFHEYRRGYRRSRRVLVWLLIPAGLGTLSSCANPKAAATNIPSLEEDITAAQREIEESGVKLKNLENDAGQKRDLVKAKWNAMLGEEVCNSFWSEETKTQEKLQGILQTSTLAELLGKDARRQVAQVQSDRKQLNDLVEQSRSVNTQHRMMRIGGCIALGVLGFMPLFYVRRRMAKYRRKSAAICPRCLAADTLATVRTGAKDQHGVTIAFVECKKCRFRFPTSNQKLPRVSFPTSGFKSSGKTQWLLTALDQVSNGQVPSTVSIETDVTQISAQIKKFLTMLRQRVPPPASVYSLPEPLTFILRDNDPWGSNRVLL
ncbi:MAG: hypothetical protein K8T89_09810, partial [Planctomycetes bacterium]|nr:hypothetical protein [Planctomycetota bacterium]